MTMEINDYHEKRYVSRSEKQSFQMFFDEEVKKMTLNESLVEFDRIILLGSPGAGKTKELERLFHDLWAEKDQTGKIPVLIKLKHFRSVDTFESLIKYSDWKKLPEIVFILDGLDEIANIQDFVSAFEIFISKNDPLRFKYVISCRTNIYEKFLINLPSFEVFFLENLTSGQALSLLENKYSVKTDVGGDDVIEFLTTPFFIGLIAKYYHEKKQFPRTNSEIWELYLSASISTQSVKLAKRIDSNEAKLIYQLKKVALVNELMQRNYISKSELYTLIGDGNGMFLENPLVNESDENPDNLIFEHRQLQEYLVAKSLSENNFGKILDVIRIPNADSVHPSLFNTVSLLLNILEPSSETFKELLNWIFDNQLEILLRADSDRVSTQLSAEAFQKYFHKECIEKKLWITTNKVVSIADLARFGNNPLNFEYLLTYIVSKSFHPRIRMSAVALLSKFSVPPGKTSSLKKIFLTILNDILEKDNLKSEIITAVTLLLSKDTTFVSQIIGMFENQSNKEINRSLLGLLETQKDIDSHYTFLENEFKFSNGILSRTETDDIIRGNDWVINDLMLQLKKPENFISLVGMYFINNRYIDLDSSTEEKFLEKFIEFYAKSPSIINRFLDLIDMSAQYFHNENFLLRLVEATGSQNDVIRFLLGKYPLGNVVHFVGRLFTEQAVEDIATLYAEGKLDSDDDLRILRNVTSNTNQLQIALKLEAQLIAKGFVFIDLLHTENEIEELRRKNAILTQKNFDILFKKDLLLVELDRIIEQCNGSVDQKAISEITSAWYKSNGAWSQNIDTAIIIMQNLVYRHGEQDRYSVREILLQGNFALNKIRDVLQRNVSYLNKITVSLAQKKFILAEIAIISSTFDFAMYKKHQNTHSYFSTRNHETLTSLFYFQKEFDITLPKAFLLDSIEFYIGNNNDSATLYNIASLIGDQSEFESRIVSNILYDSLNPLAFSKHIDYALEHRLSDTFDRIREYFLNDEIFYGESDKLEKYLDVTKDFPLLLSLLNENTANFGWHAAFAAIKHRIYLSETMQKAIHYLESKLVEYEHYAVGILLRLNHPDAINYFFRMAKNNNTGRVRDADFSNYNSLENLSVVGDIFKLIYDGSSARSAFSTAGNFITNYVINVSKKLEGYQIINQVLAALITSAPSFSDADSGIFYLNLLIDNSHNSYLSSMSKPYQFKDAVDIADKILS